MDANMLLLADYQDGGSVLQYRPPRRESRPTLQETEIRKSENSLSTPCGTVAVGSDKQSPRSIDLAHPAPPAVAQPFPMGPPAMHRQLVSHTQSNKRAFLLAPHSTYVTEAGEPENLAIMPSAVNETSLLGLDSRCHRSQGKKQRCSRMSYHLSPWIKGSTSRRNSTEESTTARGKFNSISRGWKTELVAGTSGFCSQLHTALTW